MINLQKCLDGVLEGCFSKKVLKNFSAGKFKDKNENLCRNNENPEAM